MQYSYACGRVVDVGELRSAIEDWRLRQPLRISGVINLNSRSDSGRWMLTWLLRNPCGYQTMDGPGRSTFCYTSREGKPGWWSANMDEGWVALSLMPGYLCVAFSPSDTHVLDDGMSADDEVSILLHHLLNN